MGDAANNSNMGDAANNGVVANGVGAG